MTMMRSLFAGVSGLRNHQVRMDVIGNNIANVNTVGFKGGRVTFEEALAVTLRGATRPTATQGGLNPFQIGLGMSVGSVDTLFRQGNLQNTGQQTDLAIDGEGFFVLSDGSTQYFTRAGSFGFDANGRLVDPTNGLIVQGRLANSRGVIASGARIQDIQLPFGQRVPAKATTKIDLTGNLSASELPRGTITDSTTLLAVEEAGDGSDVQGLFARGAANSTLRGLIHGITTVTVNDGTTTRTYTYVDSSSTAVNEEFHSLDDLLAEINADFAGSFSAALAADGSIVMTDLSGSAHRLTFSSNNVTLQTALAAANGVVDSSTGTTTRTDQFSHTATGTELLTKLRNSVGESLDLAVGDVINLSALVGSETRTGSLTVTAGTTLQDLAAQMRSSFGINNPQGVTVDSDGSIQIQGDAGLGNAVSGVSVRVVAKPTFNAAMTFTETQQAEDVTHALSITVFDELGEKHVVTLTFTRTDVANQWRWEASLGGNEVISSGNSGRVTFNSDGSLSSFIYDNGLTSFKFEPMTGAAPLDIAFDPGKLGEFNGLTQFASLSTAVASAQDGYGNGDLSQITIDGTGQITGIFTNGVTQTLAQIVLASFSNPAGLMRSGDNVFSLSPNSGTPVIGVVGESSSSTIVPGALEMSNVDLAQEFTDMIIAQRGFQANARVITTSDDLLNELVNLKR